MTGVRAVLALLLCMPALAQANAGIGYFLMVLPIALAAFIPVVPAEALVISGVLRLPYRQALMLSLRANLRSTLWGLGLAIVIDLVLVGLGGSAGPEPTRIAATVMLVPLFLLSWRVEHRSIVSNVPGVPARKAALATALANILSYAAMIAAAWMLFPATGAMSVRPHVAQAIAAASEVRLAVGVFHAQHGRFPVNLAELEVQPASKVAQISLEKEGRVSVRIVLPAVEAVHGKRLVFTPAPNATGGLDWRCASQEIEARLLPLSCRPGAS
jgi:hypothetical protein